MATTTGVRSRHSSNGGDTFGDTSRRPQVHWALKNAMRVAFVSDWFLPRMGGIELQMRDVALRLLQRGCDVVVLTTTPGPDQIDGIPIKRLDVPLMPGGFSASPWLVGAVRSALRVSQCDIQHVHMSVVSPLGYAAIAAARDLALPTLMTYHSVLGHSARFLSVADRLAGWSALPNVAWSGVSDRVAAELRAALPRTAVTTLWNGVDPAFWRAAQLPDDDTVSVVSAIRLNRRKRPLALLRAFQAAQAMAGGRRLTLRIAGAGPQRAMLQAFIVRHGLEDRVTLLGLQSREALRALYASADIFVLPSIREAFGIAALEARCAGLPVVAMREAGCADFLSSPDKSQLLADSDDELALHIARLATDTALRRNLGTPDAGLQRFDWSAIVDRHLALYRELAA